MQRRAKDGQFPLIGALGLSLGVHLLLLLLGLLFPATMHSLAHDAPEVEPEITFSFADLPDTEADHPAEDVAPDGSAVPPTPFEMPPLAPEPSSQAGLPAPEPAWEAPAEPAAGEAIRREPAVDEGATASTVQGQDATGGGAEPRRLDVGQALRDFGRTLADREPTPQVAGSGGSDPSRNVIVPDLSTVPSSGFGMGALHFESGDYDWNDYGRQVYFAIWRAWHRRLWQTTDEFEKWAHKEGTWVLNHQNQISFAIERSGQITAVRLEGSSGSAPLDRSALDALAEAILPPLPADFPREREVVHARFVAIGEIPSMRPHLERLKAQGAF